MEEEIPNRLARRVRLTPWHGLFALLLVLFAAGCATPTPPITAVPNLGNAMALPTDLPPLPSDTTTPATTPLPVVRFMGVEFGYDEAAFGPLHHKAHHPPVTAAAGLLQPEHLQFSMADSEELDVPQLYIYPVTAYEALSEEAAAQIDELRRLLDEQPAEFSTAPPLLPLLDALITFNTPPTYFDFRNGRGLGYVVRADHDHSLQTAETLFYTYQGLTDNGAYYVAALFPLAEEDLENGTLRQYSGAADPSAAKSGTEAKWAGFHAGAGLPDVERMLSTLFIDPVEAFARATLPAYATTDGAMLAYDPQHSGQAAVTRLPAVVSAPDGTAEFLPGVPDLIQIAFESDGDGEARLTVQPLGDGAGNYFAAIPGWQRDQVAALSEAPVAGHTAVSFAAGSGQRWLNESADTYIFRGVTEDGRYLVDFQHPLPATLPAADALAYLDEMVASLLIEAGASTVSSVPQNTEACLDDAVFGEDVTVPDRTVVERGETFVKIWRVTNTGSCTWTPAYEVTFAQGNPLTWQALPLTAVVPPGGSTEVGITVQSPEVPAIYQAWFQMADEAKRPFGSQLSLLFEAPRPATDIPGYGVIEGAINYPAGSNPELDIYFQNVETEQRYAMRTEKGWTRFANAVPVGTYVVFARVGGDESGSGGGYTQAVICGLHASCDDHSLVEVEVREGKARKNTDILDWFAPAGTLPLP